MEKSVLRQAVEQRLDEPGTVGRLASHLRQDEGVEQEHKDGRTFQVYWRERPGHWRCTIFVGKNSEDCIAQIDLHEDGDVRVELHEPGSITVSEEYNLLVLTRFRTK